MEFANFINSNRGTRSRCRAVRGGWRAGGALAVPMPDEGVQSARRAGVTAAATDDIVTQFFGRSLFFLLYWAHAQSV